VFEVEHEFSIVTADLIPISITYNALNMTPKQMKISVYLPKEALIKNSKRIIEFPVKFMRL